MKTHSQNVGEDCIKRAKGKYGIGWQYLSEEQQRGAIALEVVSVALACLNITGNQTAAHVREVAHAALWPNEVAV